MRKLFFIPTGKINARIAETVIPGGHIVIDKFTYQQLTRRPAGKQIRQRLVNEEKQERILIYG